VRRLATTALLVLPLLLSCSPREVGVLGEGCGINTDCASPLGCRLGSCRRLCVESRDCGAGFRCLIPTGENSGGCQLPEETSCTLNSECPDGFDCVHATCTVSCVDDGDCAVPGAICARECPMPGETCTEMEATGPLGCQEPLDELCIYDSECPLPYVCAFDGTCQLECRVPGDERDCPGTRVCSDANICVLP